MPYAIKIPGIYKITNIYNNKCYIGQALSIMKRFAVHRNLLLNNKHYNNHLQASWNKYGSDAFVFEILEKVPIELLDEREEYYILNLKDNNNQFGYNKRIECKTNKGIKVSDGTKEKMRLSHLGHKRSKKAQEKISRSRFKSVYQIDKNLHIVNKFESIKQASEITGFCCRSISLCATKKMNTHPKNEYYWCFETDYVDFKKPTHKRWKQKIKSCCS